ncbi:PREDICTED: sodium/hydrogen exchanger 10 [Galeopterus variegatus]|uniref:Sodium/hydrogen exchanger 10 n=1 Tax=Galeopterus variegatus TaxID=482537 RepID=A0ABM0QUG4_GALVR|nr:PREDICTED: sodium/hydrogen exchanger 10 [Galeopterus variegatus]
MSTGNQTISNVTNHHSFSSSWLEFLRDLFLSAPQDLPEIILILSLITTIGAFLNLYLRDFPIPLPVILFLFGCCFEILSFISFEVQRYAQAIQWMNPDLFFGMFTPVIIFNVAFDMDVYMLQKLLGHILLITIPGFLVNYTLIICYLASVNKLLLKSTSWLLFSAILVSSDPMLTAAAIRDLGLSRDLVNLINGESLMTSAMSLITFSSVMNVNLRHQTMNHTIARGVMHGIWSYFIASFLFGILSSKLIQLWMSTVFGDDVNHISLIFSILYLIFYICELVGMSGIYTVAVMGLFLHSTSFKPGVEALLLESNYVYMVKILFHGVLVCLITLTVNRFILPTAVTKLGLRDVTSTKYKSVYYTFQHFQELTKSTASALKFDKDLANADWSMVEKAITLQNPYALNQEETTEHQKVRCPDCNKEIDETLNIEAMELSNRRLMSAQIASYQRQYRNEILTQSAVQVLVGAAGSVAEKTGEHMSPETIKNYSESKKLLNIIRKLLLNWIYNTKKNKGIPSRHGFLRVFHKIVFTDEFEYVGYLVILMNIFPILISWIPRLNDIYDQELIHSNYVFLMLYILEALFKIAAMRKDYFSNTWNLFELAITLIGIIDVILIQTNSIYHSFDFIETVVFMKVVRLLRILCILKLITPKLLQIIDQKLSHQLSFTYAILKGYVQGEADIMTIIDQIASTEQVKQVLLKRVVRNMEHAMKELGYLEYDHPEIAVTMKTKEEINVMLNMAREIVKDFRLKGIIHKTEAAEINKLIMAKKREVLDFPTIISPLTVEETLYHIPWLDKDVDLISFIERGARVVTFDCGNSIYEEGDEARGIYVIISGLVKFKRSKPGLESDQILSESEAKEYQIIYTDYVLSGEIIGELNCLTNEPMKYSATCETVVETYFIPKNHLYKAFEQCCPLIEYKMWLKIGLSITAQKIRERLSYEDWNYKMQLKLSNLYVKDIPKNTKTNIYDETVIYVILIHGAVEDCQLRKVYKAPFLIPITCHQIQGTEDFTKVMIIQTPINEKKFRWNTRKYVPPHKDSLAPGLTASNVILKECIQDKTSIKEDRAHNAAIPRSPSPCSPAM